MDFLLCADILNDAFNVFGGIVAGQFIVCKLVLVGSSLFGQLFDHGVITACADLLGEEDGLLLSFFVGSLSDGIIGFDDRKYGAQDHRGDDEYEGDDDAGLAKKRFVCRSLCHQKQGRSYQCKDQDQSAKGAGTWFNVYFHKRTF